MMEERKNVETREQTLAKILFFLAFLTDEQLRMVKGFIKGLGHKRIVSSPDPE